MPETGTSGSMSGDGKRSDGQRPQVTAQLGRIAVSADTLVSVESGPLRDISDPSLIMFIEPQVA